MKIKDNKQLVALILAAVSVLLLLFPWVTFSGETGREFRAMMKEAKEYGYSTQEILESSLDFMLYMVPKDTRKQAGKMVKALSDGKLSAWEAVGFSRALNATLKGMKDFAPSSSTASTTISRLFLGLYPLLFLATLLLGLGAFALRLIQGGKHPIGRVYAILQAVLLVFFLIFCIVLHGSSKNMMGDGLSFRVTLFALLSVALAFCVDPLAEQIAKLLPASALGDSATPTANTSGWRCSCGNVNADASAFCSQCGKAKPAPRVCPQCGQPVPPEKSFCGQCGTKLDDSTPEE